MPQWIGDESSHQAEARTAKAVADLAALLDAATAADESLGTVLATPPPWLSGDLRARVAAVRTTCQALGGLARQVAGSLAARGDSA